MSRLVFVDSKNRDVQVFPNGNSYVLHLTTPIKNVTHVDLVSARVPNTMYNLTDGSNAYAINSSNVSMNPGFYSVYGIEAAVTSSGLVTATYLPDEGKFIFSGAGLFTIKIQSSELARMVGLSQGVTYTAALAGNSDPGYSGKYIVRSPTLVDMSLN